MKPLVWLTCFLILLSSCSVLTSTGIEKRKYTKGFYFDRPSHPKEATTRASSSDSAKNIPVTGTTNSSLPETAPASSVEKEKTQQKETAGLPKTIHEAVLKKHIASPVSLLKDQRKIFKVRKENSPGPGEHSNSKAKKKKPTTWADVLFEIIFRILVVLLALALIALFPAMPLGLAELLAVIILIGIILLIYWWTEQG